MKVPDLQQREFLADLASRHVAAALQAESRSGVIHPDAFDGTAHSPASMR